MQTLIKERGGWSLDLGDKVADDAAVVDAHARAVSVEDPRDPDLKPRRLI